MSLTDLLKGGNHVAPVVLDRAVGSQLQAAVQHWPPQAVEAHWVHVMCTRIGEAGGAGDALDICVTPPVQRLLESLDCLRKGLELRPCIWSVTPVTRRLSWYTSATQA